MNKNLFLYQAYCYHGQTLLASDKCGEAIRSLQEAEKCKYSCQNINSLFENKCFIVKGSKQLKEILAEFMKENRIEWGNWTERNKVSKAKKIWRKYPLSHYTVTGIVVILGKEPKSSCYLWFNAFLVQSIIIIKWFYISFTCSLCKGRSIVQRIWRNQRTWTNGQTFRTLIL